MKESIFQKDYMMVFWASEDREPVETVLKMNKFLSRYGDEYVLKYLNEKTEVTMDRKSLEKRCFSNNSGDKLVVQNYFSRNLIWFSLDTGVSSFTANAYHKLPEVMKIDFDLEHLQGPNPAISFEQLQELFNYCLHLFAPYYGRLQRSGEVNYELSSYRQISNSIDLSKIPATVEWFNYFGLEWVEQFGGLKKILSAPVFSAKPVTEPEGVILILQEEPFDFKNPVHLQKRQLVEDYLNLKHLHQQFAKK